MLQPRKSSPRQPSEAASRRSPVITPRRLVLILVPAAMAWVGVTWSLDSPRSYHFPLFLSAANFIFLTLSSGFVAFLAARTFLATAAPGFLLLGVGALIWGFSGVLSTTVAANSINAQITIYNVAACAAAAFHLAGVLVTEFRHRPLPLPGVWLSVAYLLGIGAVVLAGHAALAGLTPVFFVNGAGPTPIRQAVLGAAILMFGATGLFLFRRRPSTPFFDWYSLALCLLAVGLSGVFVQSMHGSMVSWAGRAAQWAGGACMLVASIVAVRESRVWRLSLEAELSKARQRTEAILETISDGFIVLDPQWRFAYVNRAAERMVGSRGDLIGRSYLDVFPACSTTRFREEYLRAAAEGTAVHFEEYYPEPLNRWYECHAYPGPDGVSVIFRDVTGERDAREKVRVSEQRFREAVEYSPNAYAIYDAGRRIRYINAAAAALVRRTPGSVVGKRDEELWPSEAISDWSRHLSAAYREKQPQRFEMKLGEMHGAVNMQVTFVPLLDEEGGIREVIGIAVDLTEHKRAEEALLRAKAELAEHAHQLEATVAERTAKLKSTVEDLEHFSYAIVHDMRAPLRAMQGFAGILLDEEDEVSPADRRAYLERIRRAANRMDNLISGALSYGKVRTELNLSPIPLLQFLRSLTETYPNLRSELAEIVLDKSLPVVLAEEAALTQCFSNLLGNAVKFVRPGTRPHVHVYAEKRGELVRIWVRDNGIGIPHEYQSRLFQLFARMNADYEGTGIGLAVVRRVVQALGGAVGVESSPGEGSRFWVELKPAPLDGVRSDDSPMPRESRACVGR